MQCATSFAKKIAMLGPVYTCDFLASCDYFTIDWVLNPIENFVGKESQDHKNLYKFASVNRALGITMKYIFP